MVFLETILRCNDNLSNQFWKISISGNTFTITYGKAGTCGVTKKKQFETTDECIKESQKLIKAKLKIGYRFSQSSQLVVKNRSITEGLFWATLSTAKTKSEYPKEQIKWLVTHLSRHSIKDIVKFDYIFNTHFKKSYDSNFRAAAQIILGNCTDECFAKFRSWALYLGKKEYEAAIQHPETLLPYLHHLSEANHFPQLEELISVASLAYEEKTGLDDESYYDIYHHLTNDCSKKPTIHTEWDEKSLRQMFPLLWEAFGESPLK